MPTLATSSEVNLLVYHYLKESGFHHACYSLRHEARLDEEPLSHQAVIEPARLLSILQKGLLYASVEAHVNPDGTEKPCSVPFKLVGPPHVCDGKSRHHSQGNSPDVQSDGPSRQTSPPPTHPQQRLTPELPEQSKPTTIEVASQTEDAQPASSLPIANGTSHSHPPIASSSKHRLDDGGGSSSEFALPDKKQRIDGGKDVAGAAVPAAANGVHLHAAQDDDPSTTESTTTTVPLATRKRGAAAAAPTTRNGRRAASRGAATSKRGKAAAAAAAAAAESEAAADAETVEAAEGATTAGDPAEDTTAAPARASKKSSRKGRNRKGATSPAAPVPNAAASRPRVPLTGKAKGRAIAPDHVHTLTGHRADVYVSAWNPTVPDLIASGAGDATVRIWTLPSTPGQGQEAPAICKHLPTTQAKDVASLDWNPDGTLLASGSHDGILRLWTPQGELHLVMSMHQGPIFAVRWNRAGTMLLTASGDGTAIVWDLGSGKVRQQYPIHSDSVLDIDWLVSRPHTEPSSTRHELLFATASADNSINLCRLGESKPVKTLRGHDDEINAIRFDGSRKFLASASDDKTAKIWAIDANALVGADPETATTTRSTKRLSAGLSSGHRGASLAHDAPPSSTTQMDVDRSDEERAAAGATRHHRASSAVSTAGEAVDVVGAENGDGSGCVMTLRGHGREIYSVDWAPSGPGTANPDQPRMLATCSYDKTARIWNPDTGECLQTFDGHTEAVYTICWSPDASILVTGGTDNRVLLNRVSDGAVLKAYVAGESVFDVTWHVTSQSSSDESTMQVKSGAAGNDLDASAAGQHHRLAVSSSDRTLTVLELGSLQELLESVPLHANGSMKAGDEMEE